MAVPSQDWREERRKVRVKSDADVYADLYPSWPPDYRSRFWIWLHKERPNLYLECYARCQEPTDKRQQGSTRWVLKVKEIFKP